MNNRAMDYEAFKRALKKTIQGYVTRPINFIETESVGINETLESMIIKLDGENAAPIIYPAKLYEGYRAGLSLPSIAVSVADTVNETYEYPAIPDLTLEKFTRRYGLINGRANRLAFDRDSSYYLLCSIEILDDDGKLLRKADMFTKRTIKQHRTVTSVDTASEALAVSIGEHARVDLDFMGQLTGKTEAELIRELSGVIYKDPTANTWQTADEYLSGNVRRKLRQAKKAAERDSS